MAAVSFSGLEPADEFQGRSPTTIWDAGMSIELRNCLFSQGAALVLHGEPGLTDADISSLRDFTFAERQQLSIVVLSNTGVTGDCLRSLACLPNLREIYLNGTGIGDDAPLDLIAGGIQVVNLDDTRIGDTGAAKLREASALRLVSLRNTKVTDHSAHMLSRLPQLREYYLSGTLVSDYALRRLDNALELTNASAAFACRSALYRLNLLLHRALRYAPVAAFRGSPRNRHGQRRADAEQSAGLRPFEVRVAPASGWRHSGPRRQRVDLGL
jgi:hypothetical protein